MRCSNRQQAPGILDDDAVAILSFLHEVRRHDDGGAFGSKRRDAPPESATSEWVDATCRLVEKENLGAMYQGRGHGQPLFETAGKLTASFVFLFPQLKFV